MNQAELINTLADGTGENKTTVERVLKHLGMATSHALATGGEVTLPGIGKLSVATRAARTGRNPSTGATLQIPAKKVPKFSAVKALKDALA